MPLFTVLFLAVLLVGLIALVRHLTGSPHQRQPGAPPPSGEGGWQDRRAENLLAERFARGEIDDDEYRRRLALLREHR
ncbi:SHOCT domain-containing protein [Streptomyces sp. NPDC003697]